MNAEILAEWHRLRGLSVVQTESSFWCEYTGRVYQAFPFHWIIEPSSVEIENLLRGHKATGLRYSTPIEAEKGLGGYHVIYAQPHYELETLPRQSRSNVRRGLRFASIEQITLERLATEGWKLRHETLKRQSRLGAESRTWWERLCKAAGQLPGFEAFAAIHGGEIVASLLTFTCDDCVSLLYLQSATEHLRHRPNNALFYEVTRAMVVRPDISLIFAGLHSLDAPASVDEFKFRMNYEPRLVKERVVFHPLLSPLLGRGAMKMAGRVKDRTLRFPRLRKFEGMVRTAVEGKLPMGQQSLPDRVVRALSERDSRGNTKD